MGVATKHWHILNRVLPGWDSTGASLLLERESLAKMVSALILIFLLGLVRLHFRGSVKGASDLGRTVFPGKFAEFHANK
jgi:hypothetical protein